MDTFTIVLVLTALTIVAFVVMPLIGGGFLLLSSRIFRIENVTYLRAYLAYLAAYVAASIACTALMYVMLSTSAVADCGGIIFWTSLPFPQAALLFVVAIAIHMVVVPVVLRAGYVRAILAQLAAILMGGLALGLVTGAVLLALLPWVQAARSEARRVKSKLKLRQIARAIHDHHDWQGELPAAATYDAQGKPLLSWRVHLLPYLEHRALYEQFHVDEPWDSPHNKKLLNRMPDVYRSPTDDDAESSMTPYQVFATVIRIPPPNKQPRDRFNPRNPPFTLLYSDIPMSRGFLESRPGLARGYSFANFNDGTANTFLIAEAGDSVPWTKPADIEFDSQASLPKLGTGTNDGFVAALADGSARYFPSDTAEDVIRAAISHNGSDEPTLISTD